jgi:hypothetical protein
LNRGHSLATRRENLATLAHRLATPAQNLVERPHFLAMRREDFATLAGTKANAANALDHLAQATREMRATPELVRRVRNVLLHPQHILAVDRAETET